MPNANAARIGWNNLADAGGISASSFVVATPPALLQNPHVARRWRGTAGAAEYLTLDLLATQTIDCVALFGLNLGSAGLTRIRASLSDSSAQDGGAYDSDPAGASAGRVNPRYGALVHLMPAPVSARYVRIDLAQTGLAYIQAGRLYTGPTEQLGTNFGYGWNRAWADASRVTKSRGGQAYVDRGPRQRTLDLTFAFIDEAQRYGLIEDIDQFNGKHTDILMITDPTSADLGRDSIWGLNEDVTPVSQPSFDLYSKTFRIEERL